MELMVSLSIMVTISTVVAMNQRQFGAGAALKNIVNNLSLSLRQAQVYGISVKEYSTGFQSAYTTSTFNAGYGVHFNINPPTTGDNTSYVFFADRVRIVGTATTSPNGMYGSGISCPAFGTGNPPSECLEKIILSMGHTISALCTIRNGTEDCGNTSLDISFKRPEVEARIIFNGDETGSAGLSVACAEVSSSDGKKNSVVVYTTGQISVRGVACTDAI